MNAAEHIRDIARNPRGYTFKPLGRITSERLDAFTRRSSLNRVNFSYTLPDQLQPSEEELRFLVEVGFFLNAFHTNEGVAMPTADPTVTLVKRDIIHAPGSKRAVAEQTRQFAWKPTFLRWGRKLEMVGPIPDAQVQAIVNDIDTYHPGSMMFEDLVIKGTLRNSTIGVIDNSPHSF